MASNKKHYSDINVYDGRIKLELAHNDNEGCVTVCLMNEEPYYAKKAGRKAYAIAFQRWTTDADGYMTRAKFNEAFAYAIGLSEARNAIEEYNKTK